MEEKVATEAVTVMTLVDPSGNKALLTQCMALERKCFSKHEAMDVEKETRGRRSTLVCAVTDVGAQSPVCVGYAVTQRTSAVAALVKLVVNPGWRQRGVGRQLLCHALDLARDGRAAVCTLHVDEANEAAQRLYYSVGFQVTARRENFYRPGRHALTMDLVLADG